MPTCNLCKSDTQLLNKSHIIPDFYYRECELYDQKHQLKMMKIDEKTGKLIQLKKQNTGIYDKQILCSTCDNASKCINKGLSDTPKFFCEEFYISIPAINHKTPESVTKSSATKKETERNQGLCLNCTNRETCKYTIPPGGVWHCEEYK